MLSEQILPWGLSHEALARRLTFPACTKPSHTALKSKSALVRQCLCQTVPLSKNALFDNSRDRIVWQTVAFREV